MSTHPNKLAFEEGVEHIFNLWPALNLAVEHNWGGVESAEKREDMIEEIINHFDTKGKTTDVDDIEALLSQIMLEDFNTTLEDDSSYYVAKHLFKLFQECIQGNFSELQVLRQKVQQRPQVVASSGAQDSDTDSGTDGEPDDDEASDDNDMAVEEDTNTDGTISQRPDNTPDVDEDGFTLVRGRRR